MRILLIPFEAIDLQVSTGEYSNNTFRMLSQRHTVVGVKRPHWSNIVKKGFVGYLIFLYYWLKAFWFGLIHQKEIDLIYCINTPSAFFGFGISLLTHKSMVWDSCNPSLFQKRGLFSKFFFILEKIISKRAKVIRMAWEEHKQKYVEKGFDIKKMFVIPHTVNLSSIDEAFAGKDSLRRKLGINSWKRIAIFIGTRIISSNMKAIEWINKKLAPVIARNFNDAQILIIGSGPVPSKVHKLLTFTGYVSNVYEYIHASDIAIAPIWKGAAGVPSTRVIDFMACAKPVVVTDFLLEAIPQLVNGENALIAKTEEEFMQKTINLLGDLNKAEVIGRKGKELVENYYSWDAGERKLSEMLSSVMRKGKAK